MPQLKPQDPLPQLVFDTVAHGRIILPADRAGRWTHLAFHRYASCPVCNFSLSQFAARHGELTTSGLDYLPVFHSPAAKMREYYPELPPFPILVDPKLVAYKQVGVEASAKAFLHPRALRDLVHAAAQVAKNPRFLRMSVDGRWMTCPADVLIAPDGRVVDVHYGQSVGDSWTVDDVLAKLVAAKRIAAD